MIKKTIRVPKRVEEVHFGTVQKELLYAFEIVRVRKPRAKKEDGVKEAWMKSVLFIASDSKDEPANRELRGTLTTMGEEETNAEEDKINEVVSWHRQLGGIWSYR